MARQSKTTTSSLDTAKFVQRVIAAPAVPIHARGLSSRAALAEVDALADAAHRHDLDVVLVDCASSEHAVSDTISARLRTLQSNRRLSSQTLRLAEAIERADSASPQRRVDGLARLWLQMVDEHPALLLAINVHRASVADRSALTHFANFLYRDALAELAPEANLWTPPPGRIVLIGGDLDLEVHVVDFGEDAAIAIRDYLTSDEVVRRFLDSTEGDLDKLGELVDQLPANASHLALFRYDALPPQEKAIVETLAVVGGAVAPEHLHATVALLGASEFFARSLRHLEETSLLRRSMGEGRIVVALEDAGFGVALQTSMADARRAEVHRAYADAERAEHPEDPDVALLATHYCAAADGDLALTFGAPAVGRLRRARKLPQARRLVECLLEFAVGDERDAFETELALLLEESGEFGPALEACERVVSQTCTLTLQRARLLSRIGDWEPATEAFEAVAADIDAPVAVRREALLGKADAAYALGAHDAAIDGLELLLATIDDEHEPTLRDRTLVSARNTLGKIAIVRSQLARAVELFEQNRDLAANWGWDDEVARAQANLGVVALQRDDHTEAHDRLVEALEASATRGSLPRAYCLMNLASVYQRRDEYADALSHCLDAMRCAKMVGDRSAYTVSARNLATIYQDLGVYDRAMAIVQHLHDEYEGDDQTLAGGWNLLVRAQLFHDTGRLEDAEATFEQLRSARLKAVFGAEATIRIAEIHHELGHGERAKEELAGADLGERALYHGLAAVLRAELTLEDDPKVALELARTAYETLEEVGEKNEPIRARLVVAAALEAAGREAEARTELQRELGRIQRVAQTIPDEFLAHFWAKPLNRRLVERLQALNGDVPGECTPTTEADAVVETRSPEFLRWRARYADIVGEDPRLLQVFRLIDKVAKSDAPVLAYGESGTGKELVASALHDRSERAGKPFVKVNCAAFVENLLLSELFGHEKGAFTGATDRKLGRFERAHGGTIFLDEIGDISLNTQVALLRVLQEGTFERVGGTETIESDVRVVCATNRDLEEMVRRGEFRLDLYYRLKGVVIEMPPLRERRADIGLLANHFAQALSTDGPKRFTNESLQFLASYSWPGNVRELQNFARSILLFVEGETIELDAILEFRDFFMSGEMDESLPPVDFTNLVNLPASPAVKEPATNERITFAYDTPEDALVDKIVSEGRSLSDIKKRLELECIKRALIETGGNVTQAADILQMKRPRLSQIINGDEELSALKARLTG